MTKVKPAVLDDLARALARAPPLGAWVEDAACADIGAGADVFTADSPDADELELAEATCWRCPVLAECRAYAAQARVWGLWGADWHTGKGQVKDAA